MLKKFEDDQVNFRPQSPPDKLKNIEIDFNKHLVRMYDRGSHLSGVQECSKMLSKYSSEIDTVPVFLKSLLDKQVPHIAKTGQKTGYNHVIFTAHANLIG